MTLIQLMILCKNGMAKTNNIIIITISVIIFQHMTSLKISQHIWRVPFNTFVCLFLFWLICLQDTCAPSSWKRQYISICLGSKHINFYSCLAPLHSLSNISAGSRMCESRPAWINNQSQKREICETINEEKWLRIQSLLDRDLTKQRRCVCSQKLNGGGSMSNSTPADMNQYIMKMKNTFMPWRILNSYQCYWKVFV